MQLYLGCAVWSYPGWLGDVYPVGTRSKHFLAHYSHYFPAVEGNTTFYAIPSLPTIERWAANTPQNFRFCLKLPRDFTHSGLLRPQVSKAVDFLHLVQTLGDKLAMVFLQLPPKYEPGTNGDLRQFLTPLAKIGVPLALEVRHPDWFQAATLTKLQVLLASLGVDRVILDTQPIYRTAPNPNLVFTCKKPDVPLVEEARGDRVLIRFVSHPTMALNRPYLEAWAGRLTLWLAAGQEVYFFVHCPLEERSPVNARYAQEIFYQMGLPIHTLPWQDPPAPVENQLSLGV